MNIYEEVVNETLFQTTIENYISSLEEKVPPLLKFFVEEYLNGKKQKGLDGLAEIGEMLEIAQEYVADGTKAQKRLFELHLLFLESLAFIEEKKHG